MLSCVIIGALAAFGLLCAVWALCGLVLQEDRRGILVYSGPSAGLFARRYLWLREMGLIRCPLLVLEPENEAKQWLQDREIEICSRETLLNRLGIGAEET